MKGIKNNFPFSTFNFQLRKLLRDDKELIYFTAALLVVCGLLRPFFYTLSEVLIPLSFLPYLFIRGTFYYRVSKSFWTLYDKQRLAILAALVFTLFTNVFVLFKAEFLLFFFLMLDYLMVVNRRSDE